MLEVQLPGQEDVRPPTSSLSQISPHLHRLYAASPQVRIRFAKSLNRIELKQAEKAPEAGLWRVTMKIDKKKVEEHKGRLASVSCLLTAEEANRLREGTLARLPRQCQARRTIAPDLPPVST